jgi:uncharacterized protein
MKIDVSDLLKEVGAELKVDISETLSFPPVSEADKEDRLNLTSPVHVDLKLTNTGNTVLVTGTLKTTVRLSCCRCLKDFDLPVSLKLDEEYAKVKAGGQAQKNKGGEIQLSDNDFVFEISNDNIIDLGEAIRQNIIVNLPIKPICKTSCRIPGQAEEKKKKIDPRLAKLRSIKLTGGK